MQPGSGGGSGTRTGSARRRAPTLARRTRAVVGARVVQPDRRGAIWSETRITGSSAFIAPWTTIDTVFQRGSRSVRRWTCMIPLVESMSTVSLGSVRGWWGAGRVSRARSSCRRPMSRQGRRVPVRRDGNTWNETHVRCCGWSRGACGRAPTPGSLRVYTNYPSVRDPVGLRGRHAPRG